MEKIIDEFYDNKLELSKELDTELLSYNKMFRTKYLKVHKVLEEIFNKHKDFKVGVIDNLEGGLTWDYTNVEDNKRWRLILGFTELGYWIYCNAPIEDLKS